MNVKCKTCKLIFLGLFTLAAAAGQAWAENQNQVLTINPVPLFSPDGAGVPGVVQDGVITNIDRRSVVLGDVSYSFSRSPLFFSARQTLISFSSFSVGTNVGIRLNSRGQIAAMWIEDDRVMP